MCFNYFQALCRTTKTSLSCIASGPHCSPVPDKFSSLNEPALTSLCRQQPRLILLHPPGQNDVRTVLRTLRR